MSTITCAYCGTETDDYVVVDGEAFCSYECGSEWTMSRGEEMYDGIREMYE